MLCASLLLHLLVGVALARLHRPTLPTRGPVELTIRSSPTRPRAEGVDRAPPRPMAPKSPGKSPRAALASHAPKPSLPASSVEPLRAPPSPGAEPVAPPSPRVEPLAPPPAEATAQPSTPKPPVNLFAPSALARAVDLPTAPTAADRAWRPRRGVGGGSGAGGIDVGSFLAEDAARQRVQKGAVAPELRTLERRLDDAFTPTFTQADVSNRAALAWKQLRGFLRDPPKTGELARTIDPTRETLEEKMRSRRPDQAFFLGRRVEIFVRQKSDGTIMEMAVRSASGYRAFDDAALVAVEKALGGRVPAGSDARAAEVRTLWQLDATAYVVVSPEPRLVFDEASGKHEWIYPLQKRVDHRVQLVAVY